MKYNPPFGSNDPDSIYVDRNTPGAVSGSVPPAPAIEHPQREIVNAILAAGLTPDGNDLSQLTQAISVIAAAAVLDDYLQKAGGTMTGSLILNADPTAALHAATKQYVDATSAALYTAKVVCRFDGLTLDVQRGENVSSVVNDGAGLYTINFATNLPDTNYVVVGGGYDSTDPAIDGFLQVTSRTVSSVAIRLNDPTNNIRRDLQTVDVVIF
ncbi:hypothetical protein [uncultured Martelella sp.]|uniref:hypothetical protein n=1 Tax=uncultured Martelella sp. TaxID=392331 RepID=UPI0029C778E7|nr:hypothetical protein [uncultured Martelella sp.]